MALPVTTIVPFSTLPACATLCGHLYDANGACVPPAATSAPVASYDACFCSYGDLQPFKTGTAGVCDSACTTEPGGLGSIQAWFTSFCDAADAVAPATTTTSSSASTATGGLSGGSTSGGSSSSSGGTWLSTHWQWVIFLVVMVVAVIAIWVGACFWRRSYLRKKDRRYQLGKHLARASGTPDAGVLAMGPIATAGVPYDQEKPASPGVGGAYAAGGAGPGASGSLQNKERKKWIVKERT